MSNEFGRRVRELRKARGMSQKELAAKASIDFTYLSKIENARRLPPRERVIAAMAQALQIEEGELMTLAGKLSVEKVAEAAVR